MTDQPLNPPPYQPGPPVPPPFPPAQTTPPPRKRKAWPWVVGGVAGIVLLCCGITTIIGATADPKPADGQKPAASTSSPTPAVQAAATTAPPAATAPATTAPAPTTPAPPATPKPKTISGRGDDVVDIKPLTDLSVIVFKCPKCTGNTVLKSDGPENLLVNEIGAYTGKRWINVGESSQTTQFEIQATGKWTLTIGTIDQLATKAPTGKASGRGDDVIVLGGTATKAKISHSKGSSNFVIRAYNLDTGFGGLVVNEIGGYSGTRPLEAPALVQVTADGNWTISPA